MLQSSPTIVPVWLLGLVLLIALSWLVSYLRSTSKPGRVASKLYGSIVTQARQPALFLDGAIPDTTEGRLEAIFLLLVPLLNRLQALGAAGNTVARALVERMMTDIDDAMREMGIGDISVPKKVKKSAAALYDRRQVYTPPLAASDRPALARAILEAGALAAPSRGGGGRDAGAEATSGAARLTSTEAEVAAERLAGYMLACAGALADQSEADLLAGQVVLPDFPGGTSAV